MPSIDSEDFNYYDYISRNEGVRRTPYADLYGNQTIGVGHLIKPGENFTKLDDKQIRQLFDKDLDHAISVVKKDIGEDHWAVLPKRVKVALADLAFRTDWQISPNARGHFINQDYYAFSKELLNSDEYRRSKAEGTGIAPRMERNAQIVVDYANALQEGWDMPTAVEQRIRLTALQNKQNKERPRPTPTSRG